MNWKLLLIAFWSSSIISAQQLGNSMNWHIYADHCSMCHDKPDPQSHTPDFKGLQQMQPTRIYEALTTGKMAANAKDLTDKEKRDVSEYLTGKPLIAIDRSMTGMTNHCEASARLGNPLTGPAWNGWSPDPTTNARFQNAAAAGLKAEDVPKLKLKWAFAFPGASMQRGQPTVGGGWLWIGSDNGMVYALDAKSGCVHWSFEAKRPVLTTVTIGTQQGIVGRYAAYFGDNNGNVYALDAETGAQLWTVHADEHPTTVITGSVVLDVPDNRLIVPVGTWEEAAGGAMTYACCTGRGSILALDAKTGRQIWKTETIAIPAHKTFVNKLGVQQYGPSGSGVWVTPTLDLKRRAVYFGTANAVPIEDDGGASDAYFALNLDTGARMWRYQATAKDVDMYGCGNTKEDRDQYCPGWVRGPNDDVSASPILHTLADGRQLLIGAQESRQITVMDPDRAGVVLWKKVVSQRKTTYTGNLGPADDGELLYVPLAFAAPRGSGGGGFALSDEGGITAVQPLTGEAVWTTIIPKPSPSDCPDPNSRWCSSANQASVTAIPGAVFTGSENGTLRAFSSKDGKILWSYNTNQSFTTVNGVQGHGGTIGGPGPTVVDGMVYTGSGYTMVGNFPGNVLLAFGID